VIKNRWRLPRTFLWAGLLGILLLGLAACGSGEDVPTLIATAESPVVETATAEGSIIVTDEALEPTKLPGTSWLVTGYIDEQGILVSLSPEMELTAYFDTDGMVSGSAGCNAYAAPYEVAGKLVTIGTPTTKTACPNQEGVTEQERAYLAALESAAGYVIEGEKMELRAEDGTVAVHFAAIPPPTLAGTTWEVVSYTNAQNETVGLLPGTKMTATFGQDGALNGTTGCNEYGAPYQIDGLNIRILPPAATRMACPKPEGIMAQEKAYLDGLKFAATYFTVGGLMELRSDEGDVVATFTALGEDVPRGPDEVSDEMTGSKLTGVVWQWQGFSDPAQGRIEVEQPGQYQLTFIDDGTIRVLAECNEGSGAYETAGNSLTIETGVMIEAECDPSSLSEQFIDYLNEAALYFLEGENLFIDLKMDSGTMIFSNAE
jgi:heat shock protein HslJ